MSYSAPRTSTSRLRGHKRATLYGTVPALEAPNYKTITRLSGKGPQRPDFKCYPLWAGQGPEASLAAV